MSGGSTNRLDRYAEMFAGLERKSEGAFVPFSMLGYPTPDDTLKITDALIAGGADALELGIPFSDPIADGPVIQAAASRAMENGSTVRRCFELVAEIRRRHAAVPIGILVYSNLVVCDPERFYARAADSGVDSLLIADIPSVELQPFVGLAQAYDIDPILIVPPNASPQCLERVALWGRGYTYLLGRAGVTGTQRSMERPTPVLIDSLRLAAAPPALLGFGISTPDHVRSAIEAGARGAISGSAIVKLIADCGSDFAAGLRTLTEFVANMKSATRPIG